MNALYTIGLLFVSNIFMTIAWYGHLKLQQMNLFTNSTPLLLIIISSWMLALPEYACQVPANRIGFAGNGGPFNLIQLKVIQEVISLTVFTILATFFFQGESFHWNHIVSFLCIIAAVYFAFLKV